MNGRKFENNKVNEDKNGRSRNKNNDRTCYKNNRQQWFALEQ